MEFQTRLSTSLQLLSCGSTVQNSCWGGEVSFLQTGHIPAVEVQLILERPVLLFKGTLAILHLGDNTKVRVCRGGGRFKLKIKLKHKYIAAD